MVIEIKDRRISISTRRANVYNLMKDLQWHSTSEINSSAVGGTEGTRRLRELRERGKEIEMRIRPWPHDDYQYRLKRAQIGLDSFCSESKSKKIEGV